MTVKADDCVLCELEQTLRSRSGEIRDELRALNPVTEANERPSDLRSGRIPHTHACRDTCLSRVLR